MIESEVEMEKDKDNKFTHYSLQFACMQKLKKKSLITVDEYEAIKKRIMSDYHIVSILVA